MKKIIVGCLITCCAVAANAELLWELNANSFTNSGPYAEGEVWTASTGSVVGTIRDQHASGTMTRSAATVAGGISSTVISYKLVKDTYVHNNTLGLGVRGAPVVFTGDVSVELWVGSTVSNKIHAVFETGGTGKGLSLTIADDDDDGFEDEMCFAIGGTVAGGGNVITNVPETFFDGNLNQVVLTYDSVSGTASIYYNGSFLASGSVGAGVDWNGTDTFGIWGGAGSIGANTLDIIDDAAILGGKGDVGMVRVYTHVLSLNEVGQSYHAVLGSSYEIWAASYNLQEPASGDDDHDGLSNIYEYGLGGNPTNASDQGTSPEFGMMTDGGSNVFSYVYPQLSDPESGLAYFLETCTDLVSGAWTNAGYTVEGTNATGGALDFVTNTTGTIEGQKFIRLIIE